MLLMPGRPLHPLLLPWPGPAVVIRAVNANSSQPKYNPEGGGPTYQLCLQLRVVPLQLLDLLSARLLLCCCCHVW